jgi:hypothetical protein
MSAEENNKLDKIYDAVEKIHRGLYGDAENKQPGLMQKHFEIEDRVKEIENRNKKIAYYGMGLFAGLAFAWEFFKKLVGL